eukprot:scaffold867_cov176-Ochromonas_danica.AAC.7
MLRKRQDEAGSAGMENSTQTLAGFHDISIGNGFGVGLALTESLNEMVATGEMPVEEAMRVLEIFDNTFEEELRKNVLVKRNLLVNEAQSSHSLQEVKKHFLLFGSRHNEWPVITVFSAGDAVIGLQLNAQFQWKTQVLRDKWEPAFAQQRTTVFALPSVSLVFQLH